MSAVMDSVSYTCTACGQCCNSPPLLSLPELLHHEDLFVGCLGLRRVGRLRAGTRLPTGDGLHRVDEADARDYAQLAEALLYDPGPGPHDLAILTQALDYDSLRACPALRPDRRCALHGGLKPAVCEAVPFETLLPDRLQQVALLSRRFEEGCIAAGQAAGKELVFAKGRVVSATACEALARRRRDLAEDKRFFGQAVFLELLQSGLAAPGGAARIPADGYLTLSPVPALLALARVSPACSARCLRYLDRQTALIDRKIAEALLRKRPEDRGVTREFRAFGEAYRKLRPRLEYLAAGTIPGTGTSEYQAAAEHYLGIA